MVLEQTPHRGFDLGRQLSIAVSFIGILLLMSYLAGEPDGFASEWSLVIGAACFICGLILTPMFLILIRLDRIEQQISDSRQSDRHEKEAERRALRTENKVQE